MSKPPTNHFGAFLRASRQGFHWHDGLGAYLRIAPIPPGRTDDPLWHATIASADAVPSSVEGKRHVCWWEGDGDPVQLSPALRQYIGTDLMKSKGVRTVMLNDEGEATR